jgi:O-antigen ligase
LIWGLVGIFSFLLGIGRRTWQFKGFTHWGLGSGRDSLKALPWTDGFVFCYGAANVLSFCFSKYPATAWNGYREWYMGLLSQLLFVWIYFFVSRFYDGSLPCLWAGQAGVFAVALLGILNKLQLDPLGVFKDRVREDWEYTHLLSTVGNINWLCGYLSVMLPFSLIGYLYVKGKLKCAVLYLVSLLSIVLLCIQSSSSGLLILGAAAAGMFCLSMRRVEDFRRVLLLGTVTAAILPVLSVVFSRQDWATFPWDDLRCRYLISWRGWPVVVLCILLVYVLSLRLPFTKLRFVSLIIIGLATFFALGIALVYIADSGGIEPSWKNGRGALWTLAVKAFWEGGILQKLIGVGPDCYGLYIYATFPVWEYLIQEGPFSNSMFTNAHNEWLNQLVNTGILGMVSYMGIFGSAVLGYLKGAKKDAFLYLGVLTAVLYAVNATVSFQQVINAPFLFLVLGLCESRRRIVQNGFQAGVCKGSDT